jgi:hypothetical protein
MRETAGRGRRRTEVEEISNRVEHRALIKDGALWAADEATAREVWGPKEWRENFDASFGTAPKRSTRAAALERRRRAAEPQPRRRALRRRRNGESHGPLCRRSVAG